MFFSEKLYLVDGNSVMNRAYYGIPKMKNSLGMTVNAVEGFLSLLNNYVLESFPSHLCVVFDSQRSFRKDRYPEYKGTRKEKDTEFLEQFPYIKEVLQALRISFLEIDTLEGDDLLGMLACKFSSEVPITIFTGDKDLLQLVNDQVKVGLFTNSSVKSFVEEYDVARVQNVYGFPPTLIKEYKAIVGDSSDNIPGIRGIGKVAGLDIIREYGTLENMLEGAQNNKFTRSMCSKILEGFDNALLFRWLVTINTNYDEFINDVILDDLRRQPLTNNDIEEVRKVTTFYGLTNIV